MEKGSKKQKVEIYHMFWLFILGSVFGWICEVIYSLFVHGIFINHSALVIGPFDICYGICACALTFLLYKYKEKGNLSLMFISFFLGSLLEYIMSWGMELVLGFSAWDYSDQFLNINGRVCLGMSILWGILGIVWIKYIYPYIEKFINTIPRNVGKHLMIILSIFLVLDAALTVSAVLRAREYSRGMKPSNSIERFLDKTFNKNYLYNMFNNSWSD